MPEIQSQDRRLSTIETAIRASEDSFSRVLPQFMLAQKERFLQLAVEMAQKPELASCSPVSIVAGVMKAAQCGLPLDGTHAALTPYKGTATFIPMFQGLITAAMRNGGAQKLWSAVVYEGDVFRETLGSRPELVHEPAHVSRDLSRALGAYACAKLPSGEVIFEFMDRDQILAIKSTSKAQRGPWSVPAHEGEMWRKTAVRRLSKYLIKSPDFQAVLDADEEFEPREAEARDLGADTLPPVGARNLGDLVPPKTQPRTVDVKAQAQSEPPVPTDVWYGGIQITLTRPPSEWIDTKLQSANGKGRLDGLTLREVAASDDPKIAAARAEMLEDGRAMQERTSKASDFHQRLAEACRLRALEEMAEPAGEYAAEGSPS